MDTPILIYETKAFTKRFEKLMGEKERLELYQFIQSSPKAGDVIVGSGGIRKLRWSRPGMGKRGGIRVIYYFLIRGVWCRCSRYMQRTSAKIWRNRS